MPAVLPNFAADRSTSLHSATLDTSLRKTARTSTAYRPASKRTAPAAPLQAGSENQFASSPPRIAIQPPGPAPFQVTSRDQATPNAEQVPRKTATAERPISRTTHPGNIRPKCIGWRRQLVCPAVAFPRSDGTSRTNRRRRASRPDLPGAIFRRRQFPVGLICGGIPLSIE